MNATDGILSVGRKGGALEVRYLTTQNNGKLSRLGSSLAFDRDLFFSSGFKINQTLFYSRSLYPVSRRSASCYTRPQFDFNVKIVLSLPTACHLTAECNLSPSAFPAVTRFRSFGDERTCIRLLPFPVLLRVTTWWRKSRSKLPHELSKWGAS